MCGIAGVWDLTKARADLMDFKSKLLEPILQRGPDATGYALATEDPVLLVHSRLSIVDLTPSGAQPMISVNNRYCLSFNGEIYNHKEIRAEIKAKAPHFLWQGNSDTEVLLKAIELWGIQEALAKSKGMFAFALFDSVEKKMWIARDRLGEKPLFFKATPKQLLFGSDPRSFDAISPLRVRHSALRDFLEYGYCRGMYSAFEGVLKLPAGHLLEVCLANDELVYCSGAYKRNSFGPKLQMPIQRAALELEGRLLHSVEKHLEADVQVGAFLSGGLDSSLICAMAAKLGKSPRAFTVGFDEEDVNELSKAQAIAAHLKLEHHHILLNGKLASQIAAHQLNLAYPEPTADHSALPTLLVSDLASQSRKVVLTGDGADELFGGYDRYRIVPRLLRVKGMVPPQAWTIVQALAHKNTSNPRLRDKALKALAGLRQPGGLESVYPSTLKYGENIESLLAKDFSAACWVRNHDITSDHEQMLRWDLDNYLVDDILCKVDRATMFHGLEARSPFLYVDVSEFAQQLPDSLRKGKQLNKILLQKYLPANLIDGPKKGFGLPLDRWINSDMKEFVADSLSARRVSYAGANPKAVQKLLKEHWSGQKKHHLLIWALVTYVNWAAQW